jgi:hypothetical protein
MAIIPQMQLFSWEAVQPLGDLERLQWVLDTIPDAPLMQILDRSNPLILDRFDNIFAITPREKISSSQETRRPRERTLRLTRRT